VYTVDDHEIGESLARRALGADDRMHLRLQTIPDEAGRHHDGGNCADGTEGAGAMLTDLEADNLAIVNRRGIVVGRLVGEHETHLVVACRAIGLDRFHCVPLVVRSESRHAVVRADPSHKRNHFGTRVEAPRDCERGVVRQSED
jgi:hypothetical protein